MTLMTSSRVSEMPVNMPHKSGPFAGRHVHFVGIGGSGMSGLAQMLLDMGACVSGTDRGASPVTHRLAELGCSISYQQVAESVGPQVEMLVHSAAIRSDHPEMLEASRRGVEIIKYAQMLGRVMSLKVGIAIAGTHGKSTTTALTSHILLACGRDPSFVVGATCAQLGGSARSGQSDCFIVEACEFDRSFHNLHPHIGAVLNIEEDHLDYYKDLPEIIESFGKFISQVSPHGVVLTHAQDVNCRQAAKYARASVETYGVDVNADWQASGIRFYQGKAVFSVSYRGRRLGVMSLSIAGRHNIGNALVATAIATHCGIPFEQIAAAAESFRGADRRSQRLGEFEGVELVDDYGHHPTEIKATLQALRDHYRPQRLVCVFQPHQHSRTRMLLEEFSQSFGQADLTIVPDIYFARDTEADRKAISAEVLVERICQHGREAMHIPTFEQVVEFLLKTKRPGDLIVSMGAGPVWEVTHELVRRLQGCRTTGCSTGAADVV